MARRQNVHTSEVMEVLAHSFVVTFNGSASRHEAIVKIRIRSEHNAQATAMIQYLTGRLSESEFVRNCQERLRIPKLVRNEALVANLTKELSKFQSVHPYSQQLRRSNFTLHYTPPGKPMHPLPVGVHYL